MATMWLVVGAGAMLLSAGVACCGRWRSALACLLLASLALKLYAAADGHLHAWDERYHALVAKNLLAHPLTPTLYDRTPLTPDPLQDGRVWFWETAHIWLHKPPLALWLIAGSLKVFGPALWAVRLPSILLSTLAIALTFGLARLLFDPTRSPADSGRLAYGAALFHTLCGVLLANATGRFSTDHVDAIFIALIELGVYFAALHVRRGEWWTTLLLGVTVGLALLTKWLPALVVFPVWLVLAWPQISWRKWAVHALAAFVIAVAVCLPWQWHIHHAFPAEAAEESAYTLRHLTHGVEGHGHWALYHVIKAPEFFGYLVYIPLAWFGWRVLQSFRRPRRPNDSSEFALAVWLGVTYLFFSCVATKMGGYVLIAAPAVFLVEALFVEHLLNTPWPELAGGAWRWRGLALVLLVVAPAIALLQRLDVTHRRDKPGGPAEQIAHLPQVGVNHDCVVFNTDFPIEAMFHTGCVAYRRMPSLEDIRRCQEVGLRVLVCRGVRTPIPDAIARVPQVELLPPQIDPTRAGHEDR